MVIVVVEEQLEEDASKLTNSFTAMVSPVVRYCASLLSSSGRGRVLLCDGVLAFVEPGIFENKRMATNGIVANTAIVQRTLRMKIKMKHLIQRITDL